MSTFEMYSSKFSYNPDDGSSETQAQDNGVSGIIPDRE